MLVEASNRLNIKTVILDVSQSPAKQINAITAHVEGSFSDSRAIVQLAEKCDILTQKLNIGYECAFISPESAESYRTPSPETIRIIQDKLSAKTAS
jgi:phosphoribosylaminoimidazole carboxylase